MFLDFKKAFDKAPHNNMLRKLDIYLRDWWVTRRVAAFLKDGKQMGKMGNKTSEEGTVTSGVPRKVVSWNQ